jgi:hypothetical protein
MLLKVMDLRKTILNVRVKMAKRKMRRAARTARVTTGMIKCHRVVKNTMKRRRKKTAMRKVSRTSTR